MQIYISYLCTQISGNYFTNRFFLENKKAIRRTIPFENKARQPVCGLLFFTPIVNKSNILPAV